MTPPTGPRCYRSFDDEAESLHLAPGWDNLTGVGTPDGPGYVKALGGR